MMLKVWFFQAIVAFWLAATQPAFASSTSAENGVNPEDLSVGPQYGTTHVYVDPSTQEAFTRSFIQTFGGESVAALENDAHSVASPSGTVSLYSAQSADSTNSASIGYLVLDLDHAISSAQKSGARLIAGPVQGALGRSAVIQWPGGIKTGLYQDEHRPNLPPLAARPDQRVHIAPAEVDGFVKAFLHFSKGTLMFDSPRRDAAEIGKPGESYRLVRLVSPFGNILIVASQNPLAPPFGTESTGYEVQDLSATLDRAQAAGAKVVSGPYKAVDHTTAMLTFPGGYTAEVHQDEIWMHWDGR